MANSRIPGYGADDPIEQIPQLHAALDEAGRDRGEFEITIYFCPPDAETVARCKDAGVSRVLFPAPSVGGDSLVPELDKYAELMSR